MASRIITHSSPRRERSKSGVTFSACSSPTAALRVSSLSSPAASPPAPASADELELAAAGREAASAERSVSLTTFLSVPTCIPLCPSAIRSVHAKLGKDSE